jgi:hypothetical protein
MQIVLDITDEQKAKLLISLLKDLSYVNIQSETNLKVWKGIQVEPVKIDNFKKFSREELYAY